MIATTHRANTRWRCTSATGVDGDIEPFAEFLAGYPGRTHP